MDVFADLSTTRRISDLRGEVMVEPEAALPPQRQMALLRLRDDTDHDGRSQVVLATHSAMLMAHPL